MSGAAANETIEDQCGASEHLPLLETPSPHKEPFYRARPLWMLPFAFTAAFIRGMTLAPRVQVFTELSRTALSHEICTPVHGSAATNASALWSYHDIQLDMPNPLEPVDHFALVFQPHAPQSGTIGSPSHIPVDGPSPAASPCPSESEVQAGAARVQTIMIITMGSLSAISNSWWGHFGERHGRTRVLALATVGLLITDIAFTLVSKTSNCFLAHGDKVLYLAAFVEGLLGGTSAVHSNVAAYISDCTSAGSRANIFSRYSGMFFLGISTGPAVGGWLIRHSNSIPFLNSLSASHAPQQPSVTPVFCIAALCSVVNLFFLLFIFPESLSKEKRAAAQRENNAQFAKARASAIAVRAKGKSRNASVAFLVQNGSSNEVSAQVIEDGSLRLGRFLRRLVAPLAIFLPIDVVERDRIRRRKDWSLTYLVIALLGHMLCTGIFQIKYLYATHTYEWTSEQLSYYISVMGGSRAFTLLIILPFLIATFKPKSRSSTPNLKSQVQLGTHKQLSSIRRSAGNSVRYTDPPPPQFSHQTKPKITKAQLAREIKFDLSVARFSLVLDVISQSSVVLAPAPLVHTSEASASGVFERHSAALFVVATGLSSFGAGMVPAVQSLALSILQARALEEDDTNGSVDNLPRLTAQSSDVAVGKLFGAIATMQAVGQMTLGPLIFGLLYSNTVGTYPKAIFVMATCILSMGFGAILLVRPPRVPIYGKQRGHLDDSHAERGRSRASKDLRRDLDVSPHSGKQQIFGSLDSAGVGGSSRAVAIQGGLGPRLASGPSVSV